MVPGAVPAMKSFDHGNLLYFDEADAQTAPAAMSAEESTAVDLINRKVASYATLSDAMSFLFDASRGISPTDRISIHFLDEDGYRLVAHWVRTTYPVVHLGEGHVQDLRGSSLLELIRSGTTRIINDFRQFAEDHPESLSTRLLLQEGCRASITRPLLLEGRVVGILFRSSCRPSAYDLHQVHLHRLISERVGQAMEKGYLIDKLREANRAYSEMVGFLAHEFKSPVASILQDMYLFTEGYLGPLSDAQRNKLLQMVARGQHLMAMSNDYLELARMEGGRLHLRPQGVKDVWQEIVEPVRDAAAPALSRARMHLVEERPGEPVDAECDAGMLRVVLTNLLDNAVKYGRPDGEVRLSLLSEENRFTVAVRNEGQGFREEDRVRLFLKFSRLDDESFRRVRGTGVGLYLCWRIVRLHNGEITASSEYGRHAEFRFHVPRRPADGAAPPR
jgi:signal transduction histidine kinase